MEKVFDPIRKKEVPLTPEEKVRIINEALGIARDGEELSEDELDNPTIVVKGE
jgi:hypothetical protein